MLPYLVAAIILIGLPTLYVAVRYREYRKFLAGAFFVRSGMQFYFYLARNPDPADVDQRRPVARAECHARHDPLRALSCLPVFRVVLPEATRRLAGRHHLLPRARVTVFCGRSSQRPTFSRRFEDHPIVLDCCRIRDDGFFVPARAKRCSVAWSRGGRIDRSMSIVAEAGPISDRRNSPLKSRARISDGSRIRFFDVCRKICAVISMGYDCEK